MLGLKEQVFGVKGFTSDLQLSEDELLVFREHIENQWLLIINKFHPELFSKAKSIGIENYHMMSDQVDHGKLWVKNNRVLFQNEVNIIKKLPFFSILKKEFGDFILSDIYDTHQHQGEEEVYWRLVRPFAESDIGPLHKDKWFHHAFNSGYGMFSQDVTTLKLWIPIFCQYGKSGLAIAEGSHLKEWRYHIEIEDGIPRPKPDEDLSSAGATLIPTHPGNIIIFNEGILHGGVLNKSDKTRVSAEITMVIKKSSLDFTRMMN